MNYQIGAHLPFSGKIYEVIQNAIEFKSHSVQFFLGNTQSYARSKVSDDDIDKCKQLLDEHKINVFSHFPYISNLCGSVKSLAWENDNEQSKKTRILISHLEYEINTLAKVNGKVVIHVGSYPDKKKGIIAIAKSINKITFSENSMLLIENSAGEGSKIPSTLAEIKELIDLIEEKNHIGVCIDTCHLFACGDYDIREEKEVDRFFDDFDRIVGMHYLKLIHLNDSQTDFGSKVDRHELLFKGKIWNLKNLTYFLEKVKDLPIVLETAPSDILICRKHF